ncbi:MAG: protein-tyrosine-phosphatase [Alphaproteobacteria bacterium]|nr:protein-tyrosine-phosphatase [Alphaproteobacteria bacterium]
MRPHLEARVAALLALTAPASADAPPPGTRTSKTHPIRVDWVAEDVGRGGRLGLTFAPGKRAPSWQGTPWFRDLAADLDRLAEGYGAGALVSLVEEDELGMLGIPGLVPEAEARGIAVLRLPIPDGDVPSMEAARQVSQAALSLARSGQRVIFHCRGGLGRAGTLAACTLTRMGLSAEAAIARTRAARPGAIENTKQERFVEAFAAAL